MNERHRPRVVVVDDEAPIRELVRSYLLRDGMEVFSAEDGPSALEAVRQLSPDVVVLDLMLPGIDGVEVCRQLRTFSDAYVVMLTARDEEVDRIVGLSIGADDYMVKPFSPRELVARLRALLRRPRSPRSSAAAFGMEIDSATRRVSVDSREVRLTNIEFALLEALARDPGMVLMRAELLESVWGADFVGSLRSDSRTAHAMLRIDDHARQRRRRQRMQWAPRGPTDLDNDRLGAGRHCAGAQCGWEQEQ